MRLAVLGWQLPSSLPSEAHGVVMTNGKIDEGKAAAESIGESATFMTHDVSKSADWARVVTATAAILGEPAILINNAGISQISCLEECTEGEYRRVININQVSVFLGMKAVLPAMRRSTNGGVDLVGSRNCIAYFASKFAIADMTKAAALEVGTFGTRVDAVHLGLIVAPLMEENEMDMAAFREFTSRLPISRSGKPGRLRKCSRSWLRTRPAFVRDELTRRRRMEVVVTS